MTEEEQRDKWRAMCAKIASVGERDPRGITVEVTISPELRAYLAARFEDIRLAYIKRLAEGRITSWPAS